MRVAASNMASVTEEKSIATNIVFIREAYAQSPNKESKTTPPEGHRAHVDI